LAAEKTLLIRLVARADGQPVIAGFGRTLGELAGYENRLQQEIRETNAEARRQSSVLGNLAGSTRAWLASALGAAGVGVLAKKTFDYNQELEGTQIAIHGLLFANRQYSDAAGRAVDEQTRWNASGAESQNVMRLLQKESLKTAATVPQIADSFALVFGALKAANLPTHNLDEIVALTTRLTQAANAFKVPAEQMRQEINSILTAQVTQDSTIAHRLGLDNESIRGMQANGTLLQELMSRTAAYARAAEEQSNTVRGKLVNTSEIIVSTLSRAIDPILQRTKGALDSVFGFFQRHGDAIVSFVQRFVLAIDKGVTWLRGFIAEHQSLIQEMLSIAAIAGTVVAAYGAVGLAIAALTSPITLTIAGIAALALVWEKARKYSEIEVGGRPIAAYLRATAQVVGTVFTASIVAQVGAMKVLWYAAKAVFGGLGELMLAPFHFLVSRLRQLVDDIPASLAKLIPGFDTIKLSAHGLSDALGGVFKPLDNLRAAVDSFRDTKDLMRELQLVGAENTQSALTSKAPLGSAADLVKDVWGEAAEWLNAKLPSLQQIGAKAADALAGIHGGSGANKAKATDSKLLSKLADAEREYLAWINDFREQASAEGDPLSQQLAKIEADRQDALGRLEHQRRKLKGVIGIDFDSDEKAINTHFDRAERSAVIQDAARLTEDHNKQTLEGVRRLWTMTREIAEEQIAASEEKRLSLIKDSVERERQTRIAGIEKWARERRDDVTDSIKDEKTRDKALSVIEQERQRRIREAEEEALRQTRERTVGTTEFWKRAAEEIKAQFREIGQVVRDSLVGARRALGEAVDGFLADLTSGQADVMKSIGSLAKGLSGLWTKALTDILLNGKNVTKQLQDLFKSVHVKNDDGSTDYLGTALQGAGFGAMVGGLFAKPTNYAGEGGAIGGAIGAVIGSYFAAPAVGMAIGTAIGTAVGSMLQKGKDSINVAIRDGIVTVTEKGVSAKARMDVQTQVQRKVKEELKGWQSILDLFPQSVRDYLKEKKLDAPKLNLFGGVESADLTDQSALNSLSDFLSNDLPEAALAAYTGALTVALGRLGVGAQRISDLFTYLGTLQGKELRDALTRYIRVVLDAADIRDKLAAPFETKLELARTYGQPKPAAGQLADIAAAIDATVARMAELRDIEDIVGAQEELNRLSQQYYDLQLRSLQHVLQIQEQVTNSFAQLREQIQLGGMDDQGKADFFFQRLLDLRTAMEHTTDADDISRLSQQVQQYVSQAYGLAPDNAEMRSKLLDILGDVESIAQSQLEKAKAAIAANEERDAKVATALERASELLLKAAGDLAKITTPDPEPQPGTGTPSPGNSTPVNGGGTRFRIGNDEEIDQTTGDTPPPTITPATVETGMVMIELVDRLDIHALRMETEFSGLRHDIETFVATAKATQQQVSVPTPEQYAAAVASALAGMTFTARTTVDGFVNIDSGELVERAKSATIITIQRDPDILALRN
jgi:hypothetical protein